MSWSFTLSSMDDISPISSSKFHQHVSSKSGCELYYFPQSTSNGGWDNLGNGYSSVNADRSDKSIHGLVWSQAASTNRSAGTPYGDSTQGTGLVYVLETSTQLVYRVIIMHDDEYNGNTYTSSYANQKFPLLSASSTDKSYFSSSYNESNKTLLTKYNEAAAAAAAAAAWPSLQSLSVPTTTTLSSANSTKSTAQGYWNTISQAGSGWTNYSAAQSKYNEIVTAVSNIEVRDNAYNSLTGLTTPTNTTVQATAKTAKDNADTYWSTIQSKTNSGWSNWSAAETKHTEVVEGYNNTVTRDTRLNKKADKTELNASNTKVRVDYTTPHTRGTADYSSIKSTLTSVNKRLNS